MFFDDRKCYICRELMRHEFRVFITIRLPPYIVDPVLGVEHLKEFLNYIRTSTGNMVKFVAVLSIGKLKKLGDRYSRRYERLHIHILAGAKQRIGWRRVRREDQVEAVKKFISDIHRFYQLIFGSEQSGAIDVRWIRYPRKSKRKHRRGRGVDDD